MNARWLDAPVRSRDVTPRITALPWIGLLLVLTLLAPSSWAKGQEAAAAQARLTAQEEAWEGLYPEAVARLQRAIKGCGPGNAKCTASLRASLYADLGVVYVLQTKTTRARAAFKAALRLNKTLQLEGKLVTEDALKLYAAVGGSRPITLLHTPVSQQQTNHPVPIGAELSQADAPASASVFYRADNERRWHTLQMQRQGASFSASIPCTATRTSGHLLYYVAANLGGGRAPITTATAEAPHVLELVPRAVSAPPHFPKQAPPGPCQECYADGDCDVGASCQAGRCEPEQAAPASPDQDDSADADAAKEAHDAYSRVWLGLGFSQDFAFATSSAPCTKDSQLNDGFSCFRAQGSQYHGTPLSSTSVAGPQVAAGRVELLSELVLSESLTLGLRVGYALYGQAPRSDGGAPYLPLSAEGRLGLWFGPGAYRGSTAFHVFAGGGVREVDPAYTVALTEDTSVPPPPQQLDNPKEQELTAYRRMGSAFAQGGVGVLVPFGRGSGLLLDSRVLVLFPSSGIAAVLDAGIVFGL